MSFVEIAKDVFVNPEKVISIRKEKKAIKKETEGWEETKDFEVIVSTLMNSDRIVSDFSLEETIRLLSQGEVPVFNANIGTPLTPPSVTLGGFRDGKIIPMDS